MDKTQGIVQREHALRLFEKAFDCQMKGDLRRAVELYGESVDLCPMAEAYTLMGWVMGRLGCFDKAIELCRRAIRIDPDFGNPYNDIGVHLMQLGRTDEAIPWLERAIRAPRNDCRHHPWFTLGRIHEARGDHQLARRCYARSLRECPNFPPARRALLALVARMN